MASFETSRNLSSKLIQQIRGNSALQVAAIAMDLLLVAVLARLIPPADYGVFAASLLFLAFCELIRDAGFGATIIQLPSLSDQDQRTGLTLVMLIALGIMILVQFGAPYYASFMRKPEVSDLLRVLSLGILLNSLSSISQALLLRELRANAVMKIEISSKFFGSMVVGASLAWMGYGYWALAAAFLTESTVRCFSMLTTARPLLRPLINRESFGRMTRLGSGFAVSRLINFLALRGDDTIVGRYMDAASLGIYTRAYKLMSMPADLYMKIADRIVFPALARVQDEPDRLKRAYLRGTELTALIGLPLTTILFMLSPEIVNVLLGFQWSGVIPVFTVLATATYFRLSGRASGALLRAKALIRPMIVIQLIYAGLVICGSLFAIQYGLVAVALATSIAVTIWFALTTICACWVADIGLREFLPIHRHGFLLSLTFGLPLSAVLYGVRIIGMPDLITLIVSGICLGSISMALTIFKPKALLGSEGVSLIDLALARTNIVSR